MDVNDFIKIQDLFTLYTAKFHSPEPAFQKNIELKRNHSFRVCDNTTDLALNLNLNDNDRLIVETAGLLHDIGRFEQFEKYGTFSDKKSVNHAWLSTEVIKKRRILNDLDEKEQKLILSTVYNHNKKSISPDLTEKEVMFIKILRDADKLDIWKVVTDYYCEDNGETNNTLQLDLPDTPEINPANYDAIMNENIVDINNLKTVNDFKLLQIGWIYDLNFSRSFDILQKKNYIETIMNSLPEKINTEKVKNKVNQYIRKNVTHEIAKG